MSANRPILSHMHVLVQFMKGGLAVEAGQCFERNRVQNIPFLSNFAPASQPLNQSPWFLCSNVIGMW